MTWPGKAPLSCIPATPTSAQWSNHRSTLPMASDVVMPVLAADDLGLRTDAFNDALVDTYGFHTYLSGSFVEALPLPAWSLLILLLWSTSIVHNFAHMFHI